MLLEILGLCIEIDIYWYVYDNLRLADISAKEHPVFCYLCLMFGKDLGYYWAHRSFHEWHILWVGHSVHHSGEVREHPLDRYMFDSRDEYCHKYSLEPTYKPPSSPDPSSGLPTLGRTIIWRRGSVKAPCSPSAVGPSSYR